ncbi:MAG: Lrp/AsnC ligand binding domain-containing protein [Elusimicrobia bacterium]|nr:Lrp/AsnC ligand binding domain-containing protein [Elusimicrobiota bacterium]
MKAFVLCRIAPGLEAEAVKRFRSVEGVTEVYLVFGAWDAILSVEADTIDKLSSMITAQLRGIPGVSATETLVTTNL